ncbi:MAG: NCS2 family permease [Spirochaetia bacterium]
MQPFLDKFFRLSENQTTIRKEILSGVTTFMAMAYILAVHPQVMKDAGMPVEAVAVSVALIAAIATIAMGLYSRYPFALAPGMGENFIFTYALVLGLGLSWQQGLAIIFASGTIFLILTLAGLRETIAKILPYPLKLGIGGVVGIFLIYLGLTSSGISVVTEQGFGLGDLSQKGTMLSFIGFFVTLFLVIKKVPGAMLIGILGMTFAGIPLGITQIPASLVSMPPSIEPIFMKHDFSALLSLRNLPFILVFFIGDFFGTLGTLLGISSHAGYLDKDGNLPRMNKAFTIDAASTMLGSALGMSTVTTFVESAAGVSVGGRTGLSSIITGLFFLLALFFTPVALMIPSVATAPIFIIIGFMLLDSLAHVKFGKLDETIPPLSMIIFALFSLSITTGISVGVLLYIIIKIMKGNFKEIPVGLYVLGVVFGYYLLGQF